MKKKKLQKEIAGSQAGNRRLEAPGNIRWDGNIERGNFIKRENGDGNYNELQKVALAVIQNEEGKILSVSRKFNKDLIGLPGGKVDPGEEPEEGLKRELYEETGLTVDRSQFIVNFEYDGVELFAYLVQSSGTPKQLESKTFIRWVEWEELFSSIYGDSIKTIYQHMF